MTRSAFVIQQPRAFHASAVTAAAKKGEAKAQKILSWEVDKNFAPVNILAGAEDPKILADDQYPDWLWTINDHEPLEKLEEKFRNGDLTYNNGGKRLFSLKNREKIKIANKSGKF